jgi:hypothetical protein
MPSSETHHRGGHRPAFLTITTGKVSDACWPFWSTLIVAVTRAVFVGFRGVNVKLSLWSVWQKKSALYEKVATPPRSNGLVNVTLRELVGLRLKSWELYVRVIEPVVVPDPKPHKGSPEGLQHGDGERGHLTHGEGCNGCVGVGVPAPPPRTVKSLRTLGRCVDTEQRGARAPALNCAGRRERRNWRRRIRPSRSPLPAMKQLPGPLRGDVRHSFVFGLPLLRYPIECQSGSCLVIFLSHIAQIVTMGTIGQPSRIAAAICNAPVERRGESAGTRLLGANCGRVQPSLRDLQVSQSNEDAAGCADPPRHGAKRDRAR